MKYKQPMRDAARLFAWRMTTMSTLKEKIENLIMAVLFVLGAIGFAMGVEGPQFCNALP